MENKKAASETIILKPTKGWVSLNLSDLWRYRELAFFLTWKNIKVRYQQTILGAGWAIIQPIMQMVVFNFLFNRIGQIPTEGVPEQIFAFSALLPWNLFSKALMEASRSLVTSRNMITKVYFPRMLVPFSAVLSGLVDFAIAFVILIGMMYYFDYPPTLAALAVPLYLLLALTSALGLSLWLSSWNLHYRDVGYFLPFLTQMWMFLTPIAYPLSAVNERFLNGIPSHFHFIYYLNPLVGVIEGFRAAILGTTPPDNAVLATSAIVSLVLLISGLFYFRRMERTFADKV